MKKVLLPAALLGAMLMLAGCSSISANTHAYLGTSRYQPTDPSGVEILADEPSQPGERLGEVILGVEGSPTRENIEGRLKVAAAKLGADAVFIIYDKTHIYPMVFGGTGTRAMTENLRRDIVAVAYKYSERPAAAKALQSQL
jgi:hypothetical protein